MDRGGHIDGTRSEERAASVTFAEMVRKRVIALPESMKSVRIKRVGSSTSRGALSERAGRGWRSPSVWHQRMDYFEAFDVAGVILTGGNDVSSCRSNVRREFKSKFFGTHWRRANLEGATLMRAVRKRDCVAGCLP